MAFTAPSPTAHAGWEAKKQKDAEAANQAAVDQQELEAEMNKPKPMRKMSAKVAATLHGVQSQVGCQQLRNWALYSVVHICK